MAFTTAPLLLRDYHEKESTLKILHAIANIQGIKMSKLFLFAEKKHNAADNGNHRRNNSLIDVSSQRVEQAFQACGSDSSHLSLYHL